MAKPSEQAKLQSLLAMADQQATLADELALYPSRPYAIDVVALLADPHYDLRGRAEMLAAAEAVVHLLNAVKAMEGNRTEAGIAFSIEKVADLFLAALRVLGGAK